MTTINDIKEFHYLKEGDCYFCYDNRNSNWLIGEDLHLLVSKLEERKENSHNGFYKCENNVFSVVLHITNKCNLRCSYCYTESNNQYSQTISISDVNKLIDLMNESQIVKACFFFHGGEPMMNFPLLRNIVYAIKKRYKGIASFSIQTNGTLMNKEMIDFIQKEHVDISISVDGYKEIHDENRIDSNNIGSHDRVMRNIQMLRKHEIDFAVNTVLTEHCDPLRLLEFFEKNDISGFKLEPVVNLGRAQNNNNNDKIANIYILFIEKLFEGNVNGRFKLEEGRLYSFIYKLTGHMAPIMCDNYPCGFGKKTLMMDELGNIYPCEEFYGKKDHILCNIEDCSGMKEIWEVSSKYNEEHMSKREMLCRNCVISSFCSGPCPAQLLNNDTTFCHFKKQSIINYIRLLLRHRDNLAELS